MKPFLNAQTIPVIVVVVVVAAMFLKHTRNLVAGHCNVAKGQKHDNILLLRAGAPGVTLRGSGESL